MLDSLCLGDEWLKSIIDNHVGAVNQHCVSKSRKGWFPQSLEEVVVAPGVLSLEYHGCAVVVVKLVLNEKQRGNNARRVWVYRYAIVGTSSPSTVKSSSSSGCTKNTLVSLMASTGPAVVDQQQQLTKKRSSKVCNTGDSRHNRSDRVCCCWLLDEIDSIDY